MGNTQNDCAGNKGISVLHLNIKSIRKYFDQLLILKNESFFDIICLTEVNIQEYEVS